MILDVRNLMRIILGNELMETTAAWYLPTGSDSLPQLMVTALVNWGAHEEKVFCPTLASDSPQTVHN